MVLKVSRTGGLTSCAVNRHRGRKRKGRRSKACGRSSERGSAGLEDGLRELAPNAAGDQRRPRHRGCWRREVTQGVRERSGEPSGEATGS